MTRAVSSAVKETVALRPPPIALRGEDDLEDDALDVEESPMRDGRNENSLAYLCQRFCEMYQNHSEPINIDLAAKELGIQRRRMYEILNIIQSVGLVGRLRASFYRWDGYDKMAIVLERLKEEGMARIAVASRSGSATSTTSAAGCMSPEGQRRKAVATALGERFVQIFLCNEVPQPVILEDIMGLFASCVGGPNAAASTLTNQTSCARRLYDIANVFCSIGLVRKSCAPATDNRRKKRLYEWMGPVPTATTTPLRPARLAVVAPTASPGSGSAKRVKRESGAGGAETPRGHQLRKKSRLSSGLNLEASIRQADDAAASQQEGEVKDEAKTGKVLQHPAVVALRGSGLLGSSSLTTASNTPSADKSRAMLVVRSLESPRAAAALTSLASASAKVSTASSLFNPTNAKDGSLSPFTTRSSSKRLTPPIVGSSSSTSSTSAASSVSDATVLSSMSSLSSSSSPIATSTCTCGSLSSPVDTPTALKAQIERLQKELQEAKQREQELRRRIDAQDAQIKSLSKSPASTSFLLNAGSSPLTNLAFSPFQGSHARDAFASLTGSPSPFHSGSGKFFSPGSASATRSGRPPFTRRAARVGPQLVDPAGDVDDLLPAASPHLSPGMTSIASSLLLSPVGPAESTATSGKPNRLAAAERQGQQLQLLSPLRVRTIKAEVGAVPPSAPSTPPHCNLIATAASSLLSLTPSQLPSFSPSIHRFFAGNQSDSDTEHEFDDSIVGEAPIAIKQEVSLNDATTKSLVTSSNQDDTLDEEEVARANAASPEPHAVRTPASLAAPSSPSPSAKGVKSLTRHSHSHHSKSPLVTASTVCPSSASPSASASPETASLSTLSASLEELSKTRVTGCLS